MKRQTVQAVILAAGQGNRLGCDDIAKALLEVGGKTLLERHLEALRELGVARVDIVVGFAASTILEEITRHVEDIAIRLVPVAWKDRDSLCSLVAADIGANPADSLLLMDGDVLYDTEMLSRLLCASASNAALVDFGADINDESVKLCLSQGRIVDFGKSPSSFGERYGESVGIFKLDRIARRELAAVAASMLRRSGFATPHEDALHEILLDTRLRFEAIDISGMAWIEIDFPEDLRRACDEVSPKLGPTSVADLEVIT